jgi:thiol-disulfide isomerase/thioredoxin
MRPAVPVLLVLLATASACRGGARNPERLRAAAAAGLAPSAPEAAAPPRPAPPSPGPAAPAGAPPPAAGTSDADPWFLSFRGKAPPELAADGTWVVGPKATLASLRGRVVYLQFAFLECGGCVPMMPFLHAWHRDHAASGLSVVYVDNAGVDRLEHARREAAAQRIGFSFFHDTSGETVRAYGVRAFPTGYVLDRRGVVVWEGSPGGQEAAVEAAIRAALR